MSDELIHDLAFAATREIVEAFRIPSGRKAKVFFQVYTRVKAAVKRYEVRRKKPKPTLRPSRN